METLNEDEEAKSSFDSALLAGKNLQTGQRMALFDSGTSHHMSSYQDQFTKNLSPQLTNTLSKPSEKVISPFISLSDCLPVTSFFETCSMHPRWALLLYLLANLMSQAMQHCSMTNDAKSLMHTRRNWARFHCLAVCIPLGHLKL